MTHRSENIEVLIVGGGAAGLAAALTFGRLRRQVWVCDAGSPRNAPALHMHNFPGFDGVPPEQWRDRVHQELKHYPSVHHEAVEVLALTPEAGGYLAQLSSGQSVWAQKVLLATGVQDVLPEIPGLLERWGKTVVHCPFCHGFEFQEQRLGMLGQGEMALHMLSMLLGLSRDITVFTQGPAQFTATQRQALTNQGITLVETPVVRLRGADEPLQPLELELAQGETVTRDVLYLAPQFPVRQRSPLVQDLGCALDPQGWVTVDDMGQTSVPGVYAAGDMAGMRGQSVLNSAASGSMTAGRLCGLLLAAQAGFDHA